jgi:hypothetical protein
MIYSEAQRSGYNIPTPTSTRVFFFFSVKLHEPPGGAGQLVNTPTSPLLRPAVAMLH